MVECEGDAGLPGLLEGHVHQSLLACAVVPLRQVRVAIRVLRRISRLNSVHAATTLESTEKTDYFMLKTKISRNYALLVVSIAEGVLLQFKEMSEIGEGEMSFHILFPIHHARAQGLLMSLPLEDLLLDRTDLKRSQNEKHRILLNSPLRNALTANSL